MDESYFIYFLQACFTRYRDHQGRSKQNNNKWLEKIKWYSPGRSNPLFDFTIYQMK